MKYMLSTNSKTRRSVNLPAPETCNPACPFFYEDCYAQYGRFAFGSTRKANLDRLDYYKLSPHGYFALLKDEIRNEDLGHLRVFGAGDFPDAEYGEHLVEMMESLPDTRFWVASYRAGVEPSLYAGLVNKINSLDNAIIRISTQSESRKKHFEFTSSVSTDPKEVTCPDTTCAECGWKCWKKDIANVTYKFKPKKKRS